MKAKIRKRIMPLLGNPLEMKNGGFGKSKAASIDTVNRRGRPLGLPRYGGRPKGYIAPEKWWSVPRSWEGETCFILAGGPSLRQNHHMDEIQGRARCIVINDSFQLAPWADVLYWADIKWWQHHQTDVVNNFQGITVTAGEPNLSWVKSLRKLEQQLGLSSDPTGIHTGNNSGYAAICLAYLFGARRICLLGYDMRSADGRTHWHRGHEWMKESAEQADRKLQRGFLPIFATLVRPLAAAGVEVYNCTPGSLLKAWPSKPFDWCLRQASLDRDAKVGRRATETERKWSLASAGL